MGFWKKESTLEQKCEESKAPLGSPPHQGVPQTGSIGAEAAPSTPEDRLTSRYSKIRSALGPGTVIQGRLSFDTTVRIDGRLSGDIFSSKSLIVGPSGQVDAQVEAVSLIVLGSVKGKIKVSERVEVWAGGCLDGEVSTPVLVVEEGANFAASCKMTLAAKS